MQINLVQVPAGVYVLCVHTDMGKARKRLVRR